MFETTIAVETVLLQATNGDPKENLHNSAQVTSRFNLLDCFWKDVTGGCEAWSLLRSQDWAASVPDSAEENIRSFAGR
jgi:hypothetical protein